MAIAAGTIQSASRALSLLELICLAPAPVSAKVAAARLQIAVPSTYHLLKTLEVDGGLTFPNLDIPVPDL